ncbi:hypothetical protein HK101_004011 [Irineochytrium annulatum]|nr:hypothetical protein HK101_004011 [Irineochytrium annulatum]
MPTRRARQLVHSWLAVRPTAGLATEDVFERDLADDVERILRHELESNSVVPALDIPPTAHGEQVGVWRGDITLLLADYIVNAANSALLGCFKPEHKCIDNAIHSKAGPRLRAACYDIVKRHLHGRPERVGSCQVTSGLALPARYVLHTVGPQVERGAVPTEKQRAELQRCYTACLDVVAERVKTSNRDNNTPGPVTVAFPCISTGVFGFPADLAAPLAVDAVTSWLKTYHADASNHRRIKVIFNTFLQSDHDRYCDIFKSLYGVKVDRGESPELAALQRGATTLKEADYLLISAGAGMSAAVGLDYTSEDVFKKHFPAMHRRGHRSMYEFFGYRGWTPALQWGYLLTQINLARYGWEPTTPAYEHARLIFDAFNDRGRGRGGEGRAFVCTSNADGMFGQRGFPLEDVYTPQGDYSMMQCLKPCTRTSVWPTRPFIEAAMPFIDAETQEITNPDVIPRCRSCGGAVMMNVRGGRWFLENVQDEQRGRFEAWVEGVMAEVRAGKKLVVLEVGAGFNTPSVLRFPNEALAEEEGVTLVRVNRDHPEGPRGSNVVSVATGAEEALAFFVAALGLA